MDTSPSNESGTQTDDQSTASGVSVVAESNMFKAWCSQHQCHPTDCFDVHNPTAHDGGAESPHEMRRRIVREHMIKQGVLKEVTPGHGLDCVCQKCSGGAQAKFQKMQMEGYA